jgi:hypothetical protein
MIISIGTVILAAGNSENERPYALRVNNSRQFQTATAVGADTVRNFDRGNQQTTVEFRVSKKHSSVEEAQAYVLKHAASLKNLSPVLTITAEPSGDIYSLGDAIIGDVQSQSNGIVSSHFYKIIGGNFSKTDL